MFAQWPLLCEVSQGPMQKTLCLAVPAPGGSDPPKPGCPPLQMPHVFSATLRSGRCCLPCHLLCNPQTAQGHLLQEALSPIPPDSGVTATDLGDSAVNLFGSLDKLWQGSGQFNELLILDLPRTDLGLCPESFGDARRLVPFTHRETEA